MALKRTIEGEAADDSSGYYRLYVREEFMSKIKGRNNSNINKLRKKYGIKIECVQEGSSNPHFKIIGKKSNVKKAVKTLKCSFKQYILKSPKKNINGNEGKQKVSVPIKALVNIHDKWKIYNQHKQYDLRIFQSGFPNTVITVIGLYYYRISAGIVKLWKPDNKYGFIVDNANSQDVFVHFKDIQKYPRKPHKNRSLRKGEIVEFVVVHNYEDGRTKAIFVTGPNGQSVKGYPFIFDDRTFWTAYVEEHSDTEPDNEWTFHEWVKENYTLRQDELSFKEARAIYRSCKEKSIKTV